MTDVEIIAAELLGEIQSVLLAYSRGKYEFDGSTLIFTPVTPSEYFGGDVMGSLVVDQVYYGNVHSVDDSASDQEDPAFAVSGKYFTLIRREDAQVFIKVFWRICHTNLLKSFMLLL